jgi:hypothetical protein
MTRYFDRIRRLRMREALHRRQAQLDHAAFFSAMHGRHV